MQCFYFGPRADAGYYDYRREMGGPPLSFEPLQVLNGPGIWRGLAIEVHEGHVKSFWKNSQGLFEIFSTIRMDDVAQAFSKHVAMSNPQLAQVGADFNPRKGLGLYVFRGTASFKNVRLIPLTNVAR